MEKIEVSVMHKKIARKKRWVLVGIIMLLLGMAIELMIGNYKSILILIPVLYLHNLRKALKEEMKNNSTV